jgi:ABC-type multidrug transport system fused ATPase/permease subunit
MMVSMIVSALIVGFFMEPKLAGIFLALLPFYILVMGYLGKSFMAGQIAITKAYSMSNGYA